MTHISWEKPKKAVPHAEHAEKHQSDSGIPGTYVPNMSQEDRFKWKGRHIKTGKDQRVEIRKTLSTGANHCDLLVVVRYKGPGLDVTISGNNKQHYDASDYLDLIRVVQEAYTLLVESRTAYQEA